MPANYSKQFLKWGEKHRARGYSPTSAGRYVVAHLARAERFVLPQDGVTLGDFSLKGLEDVEELRLPFPLCALEYPITPDTGGAQITKQILFLYERDGYLNIQMVPWSEHFHEWITFNPIRIPMVGWSSRVGGDVVLNYEFDMEGDNTDEAGLLSAVKITLGVVMDFLNILACDNVYVEQKLDFRDRKRPKTAGQMEPKHSYRYITVGKARTKVLPGEGTAHDGERRRPREHMRRGHIRRLRNGKKRFFPAVLVNAGVGTKADTTYIVRRKNG